MKSLRLFGLICLLTCGTVFAASAQDAPAKPVGVSAKVGVHPRYISIVMHWQAEVHTDGSVANNIATVIFDTPAKLDMAALNEALPEALRPAKLSADRTTLTLPIPDQAELRIHNRGMLVYFDVLLPPVIHNFAEPPEADTAPVKPVAAAPPPQEPPPPVEPPKPVAVAAPADAPKSMATAPPAPADAAPLPPKPPILPPVTQELTVHRTILDDGVSYRFDWINPAAAAIFTRGGAAWVVFDRPQDVTLAAPGLTHIDNASATVLRIAMTAADHLQVGRIGATWMVELHHGKAPAVPGGVMADGNFYQTMTPAHPVTIADPESPGLLIAVPSGEFALHFARTEDHGDYQALATIQGLAFLPHDDNLRIGIGPTGVTLGATAEHH